MTIRFRRTLCLAMVLGWSAVASILAADRPNVLILLTDDQRYDTIAALGNPDIMTPTLDELVGRGCAVTSAYCLGANIGAVCRPSRNMILSGRTYFRWTNVINAKPALNAPALPNTLPATFNRAGYVTYHHGKRGNSAELIHKQFDHSHYLDDFAVRWSMHAGQEIVDDAIEFLGQAEPQEKPWLMYLAFATPHDPRAASPEALSLYDADSLKLPENVASAHPFDNGSVLVRDEWTALWPRSPDVLRDQWHDYYATITTIDMNIARLIAVLRETNQLDNTIIAFSSDHGLGMGSHGLMGKQNVYDAGFKPPMILAGPGIRQGQASDPVYLMDLFPTLCELCGIDIPAGLDGRSFAAMLTGANPGPRQAIMLSYSDSQRAIRKDNWKMIRYPKIDRTQLFNLESDPNELINLSEQVEQQMRITELSTALRRLQREAGDTLSLTAAELQTGEYPVPEYVVQGSGAIGWQDGKPPKTELHRMAPVGWTAQPQGTPFVVERPENGHFTAIAIGLSRGSSTLVSGLRFDLVDEGGGDRDRHTIIVGDASARWMPLFDQMNPKRQPSGIFGSSSTGIDRLGFARSDGKRCPAYGGAGGTSRFDLQIAGEDAAMIANSFAGFYGTTVETANGKAIESLGMLYVPAAD